LPEDLEGEFVFNEKRVPLLYGILFISSNTESYSQIKDNLKPKQDTA
jgi:hypothetical protein